MEDDVKTIKVGYLNDKIAKLLREGSKVLEVTYDEHEKQYLVKSRLAAESQKREKEEAWKSDYERLKRMEKRINVFPDLRKAVRAAMEHDDRSIGNYINRFREALQESINNKDVMELEALKTVTREILELIEDYSPAGSSTVNN